MQYNAFKSALAVSSLCLLCSFTPARPAKNYTVSGYVKGLSDQEIYLTYGTLNHSSIDTLITHNGSFVFKGHTEEPMAAMIFTKDYRVKIDFYIDNAPIKITASLDSMMDAQASGLAVTNEFAAFNSTIMKNRKATMAVGQKAWDLTQAGDTINGKKLQHQSDSMYQSEFTLRRQYIEQNPKSYVALHELQFFATDKNLQKAKELYAAMDPKLYETVQGKEVAERIAILSRIVPGKTAPLFVQNDVNGNPVSLASYKGKYVLIEFWASWCHPCRGESPNLLKQYKHFNSKGFEILSVSLDHVKDNWTAAIAKDGLLWTQVCDLKGWKNDVASLYGIQAVPANFLVDPTGKIVAVDLRGEALEKKLTELYQ
ncbi:TlpA disulfide reductase family protein [Deminuibacter soli]|nr:TlpA disulfide reductase family protein [Deminuibacter soli]